MRTLISVLALASLRLLPAAAQTINIPGQNLGSDGPFVFVGDVANVNQMTIDLGQAHTGMGVTWETAPPTPGTGVYDPEKWAVVFKYTSVVIPAGKTIKFRNHPKRAPVVWLVTGDVTINGLIDLSGAFYNRDPNTQPSEPGPGGFRGGRPGRSLLLQGGAGFGPGGARLYGLTNPLTNHCLSPAYAGYATAGTTRFSPDVSATPGSAYGSVSLVPLIGGSGGSSSLQDGCTTMFNTFGGGAGGGAILIAASHAIIVGDPSVVNPGLAEIRANGGSGDYSICQNPRTTSGTGGGIRLVAWRITGNGQMRARAGDGPCGVGFQSSEGRIRMEFADDAGEAINEVPPRVFLPLSSGNTAKLWPAVNEPSCRVTQIAPSFGTVQTVSADPTASLSYAGSDVHLDAPGQSTVTIECRNVDELWTVDVRIIPNGGIEPHAYQAVRQGGTFELSTWTVTVTIPPGISVIQARAHE